MKKNNLSADIWMDGNKETDGRTDIQTEKGQTYGLTNRIEFR